MPLLLCWNSNDIYIRDQNGRNSACDELELLAHELVHTRQFEKYGRSYSNFGYHYFKEYKKANLKYIVTAGEPYTIRNIYYHITDTAFRSIFYKDTEEKLINQDIVLMEGG